MVTSGKGALSVQRGLFTHGSNYTDPVLIDVFILWPALLLRRLLRYDLFGITTGGTRRGRDGMVTPYTTRRRRRRRWGQRMRGHRFVGDDGDGLRSRRNRGRRASGGWWWWSRVGVLAERMLAWNLDCRSQWRPSFGFTHDQLTLTLRCITRRRWKNSSNPARKQPIATDNRIRLHCGSVQLESPGNPSP